MLDENTKPNYLLSMKAWFTYTEISRSHVKDRNVYFMLTPKEGVL